MAFARNHVVRRAGLVLGLLLILWFTISERRRDEARLPGGFAVY
jgi:hypothetical protein